MIELESARKIGEVEEVILDPERCLVAGFVVVHGRTLLGGGTRHVVPASVVQSLGPDAVTIQGPVVDRDAGPLAALPRRRDMVGRKVVGRGGRMFGHIHDVLVDAADGRVVGYWIEDSPNVSLESVLGVARDHRREYVRADAEMRVGPEIVIVPDDAVVPLGDEPDSPPRAGGWSREATGDAATSAWVTPAGTSTTPAATAAPREPEPAFEEMATAPLHTGTPQEDPR